MRETVTAAKSTSLLLICFLVLSWRGDFGLQAGQASDAQVAALAETARAAQQAGNVQDAIEAYEEILRARPHWAPVEFNLGLMYQLQKRHLDAVRLFTAALGDDPSLAPAHLFLGISYFNTNQYQRSLSSLGRFLKLQPSDREARFYIAGTYYAVGDYPNAARHYLDQIKLTPDRGELYYHLGECHLALARQAIKKLGEEEGGKYYLLLLSAEGRVAQQGASSAGELIREAIQLHPARIEAYVSLGQFFLSKGEPAGARSQFEEALRRNPEDCRALEGLADVNLAMGNLEATLESWQRIRKIRNACLEDPPVENLGLSRADFDARIQLLNQAASSSKWKTAAEVALSRLIERTPRNAPAGAPPGESKCSPPGTTGVRTAAGDLWLSSCLAAQHDLEGATQALLAAQSRAPKDLVIAYWSSRLYLRLAQTALARLEARSPGSHLIAYMRAQTLEEEGKFEEAEMEYRQATALAGQDPVPLVEYARFKCRNNQLDDAIPLLEKTLGIDPYNLKGNTLLGEVYALKNQWEAAIPYLELVIKANPHDEQSRIYLARALERLGRMEEAISLLERAPSDEEGRIHYVLAGYYRTQGRKEEASRALQIFEQRRKSGKTGMVSRQQRQQRVP